MHVHNYQSRILRIYPSRSRNKKFQIASKDSFVLIHEVSAGDFGKVQDLKNSFDFFAKVNDVIFSKLDFYCNQNKGFFKKKMHENANADLYLTSYQAKAYQIVDKVKSPVFEVEVTQKFKLI